MNYFLFWKVELFPPYLIQEYLPKTDAGNIHEAVLHGEEHSVQTERELGSLVLEF